MLNQPFNNKMFLLSLDNNLNFYLSYTRPTLDCHCSLPHLSTHPSMCSIMNIIILLDFVAVAFLSSSLDFHFIIIIPSKSFGLFLLHSQPSHPICFPIRISLRHFAHSGCLCLLFSCFPLITGRQRHRTQRTRAFSSFFSSATVVALAFTGAS